MVSSLRRLEDYVIEMSQRQEDADISQQLQQKEKDLRLAAELGKALLGKNEELSIQNERITEEYTQKLEILEQDKYLLKRKYESLLSDKISEVTELQADINELKKVLEEKERLMKSSEKEKSQIIQELTEQIQRLTQQLNEATTRVDNLTCQLQSLRDQFSIRKNTLSDHVNHLESLREEIALITSEKVNLERKIDGLLLEKEGLAGHLDDSSLRISLLEKQTRDQEVQLMGSRQELEEMKISNQSLSARLELLNRSATVNRSLLTELELSADFRTTSGLSTASSGIGGEEDEIECDELLRSGDVKQLKEELWLAYCTILAMCHQLKTLKSKSGETSPNNNIEHPPDGICFQFKSGLLHATLEELKALLRNLSTIDGGESGIEGNGTHAKSQLELEMRLHSVEENLDKSEKVLNEKTDENKRLKQQVNQLTSQLTIREAELSAVTEERDNARKDLSETDLAKDEIVKKAWELRDKAVERKNKAEIDVARTRIDMMQVNSQLMEAVQQKIQLSQQLEQWQVDMQQLLDEQMRNKLSEVQEKPERPVNETVTSTSQFERKRNKLFAIFRNFNS